LLGDLPAEGVFRQARMDASMLFGGMQRPRRVPVPVETRAHPPPEAGPLLVTFKAEEVV
jgi:hypothetical protein